MFDAIARWEFGSFVFDPDPLVVAGVDDDFEQAVVVHGGFFALLVEVVGLGADCFGVGHELGRSFVAIVPRVGIVSAGPVEAEVSKVGERAAAWVIDEFHDGGEPVGV